MAGRRGHGDEYPGQLVEQQLFFRSAALPPQHESAFGERAGRSQLWDARTGSRRTLQAHQKNGFTEVDVPFDDGPAALLVWGEPEPDLPVSLPHPPDIRLETLENWRAHPEPTLDNRYGDFDWPKFSGAPAVQTWRFEQRLEQADSGEQIGSRPAIRLRAASLTTAFTRIPWALKDTFRTNFWKSARPRPAKLLVSAPRSGWMKRRTWRWARLRESLL